MNLNDIKYVVIKIHTHSHEIQLYPIYIYLHTHFFLVIFTPKMGPGRPPCAGWPEFFTSGSLGRQG